ncbi:hypothetical protein BGZ83_007198 [Gryganskiella cystojenkinii]|nr:hypothetical protein BGZ83_007198 [Gryganskiella cystojenkinii]
MATLEVSSQSKFDKETKDDPGDVQIALASTITLPTSSKQDLDPVQEYYPEGGFGWVVLVGSFVITYCFLYVTASTTLNQYFYKRRALVAGIASSGSSIGGATLTPLIAHMCSRMGYMSTIRIMGGVLIVCVSLATGCIRPLYSFSSQAGLSTPPVVAHQLNTQQQKSVQQGDQQLEQGQQPEQSRRSPRNEIQELSPKTSDIEMAITAATTPSKTNATAKIHLDFTVFQSFNYTLLVIAAILFALAYYAPIVLVPTYATSIGLSSGQAASLISVSTGTTVILRPVMGLVADHYGVMNTMILSAFVAGLSCIALWMMAHTFTVLAVFMAVFGGFQGVLSLLFTVASSKTVTVDRMPSAMSFVIFATSVGYILGSPLTSMIVNAENGGNRGAAIFVGVIDFVCFLILVVTRWRTSHQLLIAV